MARLRFLHCDDHDEAAPGEFYKLPDDAASYLRVKAAWPEGVTMIDHNAAVAGITQPGRQEAAMAWMLGKDRELDLVPEPRNRHDRNAVKIIGSWAGLFMRKRAMLGYVPKDISQEVAEAMAMHDVKAWAKSIFPPTDDRDAGLRLKIGYIA